MTEWEKQQAVAEIKRYGDEVIEAINRMLALLENDEPIEIPKEREIPFGDGYYANRLKGNKPLSVFFPNGKTVEVKKWKEVVSAILCDCNENDVCHARLVQICDRVWGRNRIILSSSSDRLHAPIRIGVEEMFFESYFDTETLMNVLIDRVLKPIGYDYRAIIIRYKNKP